MDDTSPWTTNTDRVLIRNQSRRPWRHSSSGPGGQHFSRPDNRPPQKSADEESFLSKTSIDPRTRLQLEKGSSELTVRAIDILCPIGKGQRGLIVSPPKAGKTTFLKNICQALANAIPALKLYSLLIDERPEEVTDFKRNVPGEVHASSNDRPYEEHIRVAQNLLTKAVKEVNAGKDVVILLDSLTRLARVHNSNAIGNKTMSGGPGLPGAGNPAAFFRHGAEYRGRGIADDSGHHPGRDGQPHG